MLGFRSLIKPLRTAGFLPLYATVNANLFSYLKMDKTYPIKIILGSSSVARKKILDEMGYKFDVMTADIDEKSIRKECPEELVMALAEAKADAILSKISAAYVQDSIQTFLVTADTVVVYEGMIREKPACKDEARQFIKDYSGACAATVGSVVVTNLKTGVRRGKCDKAEIYFNEIPDKIIEDLIEEGIVLNVAGGLIIEHPRIFPFVKDVVGAVDSIMGLSKALTEELINEALKHPSIPSN